MHRLLPVHYFQADLVASGEGPSLVRRYLCCVLARTLLLCLYITFEWNRYDDY